jgi:hypothetical protein
VAQKVQVVKMGGDVLHSTQMAPLLQALPGKPVRAGHRLARLDGSSQAVGFSLRLDSMHPTEQKDSRRKGSSFKKGETFKI